MNATLNDTLTVLAQSMESLRPAGAQPAWAEIVGPFDHPERVQWHPDLETLVGFVAPPKCRAIAAVGYGWTHSMEGGVVAGMERPAPGGPARLDPGEPRRVRVVVLMTRTGDMAGYLRAGPTILIAEPPTIGRIPDFLRRCFGLATPPPEVPSDAFLAHMWLNNVRGLAERAETPLAWPTVAQMHPAMQVATEAGFTVPLSQLARAHRVAADVWSWSYLAGQAASPGWLADLLPPGAAGWMDEGVLSRCLLTSLPVDQLLDRVTPLLVPAAAKKLRATLGQLGVVPARHPWLVSVSNT